MQKVNLAQHFCSTTTTVGCIVDHYTRNENLSNSWTFLVFFAYLRAQAELEALLWICSSPSHVLTYTNKKKREKTFSSRFGSGAWGKTHRVAVTIVRISLKMKQNPPNPVLLLVGPLRALRWCTTAMGTRLRIISSDFNSDADHRWWGEGPWSRKPR